MDGWLKSISDWFIQLIKSIFEFLFDLVYDLFAYILKTFLEGVVFIVSSIPVPDFLSGHALSGMFSAIDPSIIYFLTALGIPEGLMILSGGYGFRLLRKFVTLFQW
jgi:hypothetical protein